MKKVLAALLCLMLMVSALPMQALAYVGALHEDSGGAVATVYGRTKQTAQIKNKYLDVWFFPEMAYGQPVREGSDYTGMYTLQARPTAANRPNQSVILFKLYYAGNYSDGPYREWVKDRAFSQPGDPFGHWVTREWRDALDAGLLDGQNEGWRELRVINEKLTKKDNDKIVFDADLLMQTPSGATVSDLCRVRITYEVVKLEEGKHKYDGSDYIPVDAGDGGKTWGVRSTVEFFADQSLPVKYKFRAEMTVSGFGQNGPKGQGAVKINRFADANGSREETVSTIANEIPWTDVTVNGGGEWAGMSEVYTEAGSWANEFVALSGYFGWADLYQGTRNGVAGHMQNYGTSVTLRTDYYKDATGKPLGDTLNVGVRGYGVLFTDNTPPGMTQHQPAASF